MTPPPRHGYVWTPGHHDWRGNQYVWVPGHWIQSRQGYEYREPRGDLDRDGITNQDDRDGDGIRNRRDRHPDDPSRS